MKRLVYFAIGFVILASFWLYSSYASGLKYSLNPSSAERVSVTIEQGMGGSAIGQLLAEKGLVKSAFVFDVYLRQNGFSDTLKAGRYVFKENQTLPEIVSVLVSGKTDEFSVTLLEGWTAKQMADYLEAQGLTTAEDFMLCLQTCDFEEDFVPNYLEGYLYPDTYFVNPETYTDQAFIRRLLSTFASKLSEKDWEAIEASDKSLEEIIIMASIVEREERVVAEKATVAGILWNRYDNGIGLGADATVLYALGRTSGGLNYQDLQVDSPYNTRKYAGLPPTPISNPSITSIHAALYPEDTDYFYYLHDGDGVIHYAETLEGHNQNKAKYLN